MTHQQLRMLLMFTGPSAELACERVCVLIPPGGPVSCPLASSVLSHTECAIIMCVAPACHAMPARADASYEAHAARQLNYPPGVRVVWRLQHT